MAKPKRRHYRSVDGRLRWLAPHVDGFKSWLDGQGYSQPTIEEVTRLLAVWSDRVRAAGFGLDGLAAALDATAPVFRGGRTARAPQGAAKLFVAYLRDRSVLPPAAQAPRPEETWPILAEFRTWMREQRGVAQSTLHRYKETLIDLLNALGDDPAAYTATAVRDFVLERARPYGREHARKIASNTRVFLRYLVATGRCPAGREHAVPTFARGRLEATPRFLPITDVERVVAACEGEDRLRDKAIVLLLARLGLRAGEVANLDLVQIDWREGLLTIAGKARREERLPLTQEIGDAILAYIEHERPREATDRVFLTSIAPIRTITRATVKCVVRRAIGRAGVESPHRGAHVLRHSAATAMLARGVSLAGVGAVLRHRSPSVTAIYAKADTALLSEIAQPWGGRAPC